MDNNIDTPKQLQKVITFKEKIDSLKDLEGDELAQQIKEIREQYKTELDGDSLTKQVLELYDTSDSSGNIEITDELGDALTKTGFQTKILTDFVDNVFTGDDFFQQVKRYLKQEHTNVLDLAEKSGVSITVIKNICKHISPNESETLQIIETIIEDEEAKENPDYVPNYKYSKKESLFKRNRELLKQKKLLNRKEKIKKDMLKRPWKYNISSDKVDFT